MAKKKESKEIVIPEVINLEILKDIPHIGDVSLKNLTKQNITNKLKFFTDLTPTKLIEITGMKRHDADEAFNFVRECLIKSGKINKTLKTATELYQEQIKEKTFHTGSISFDELFGNGIRAGYITSIHGENSSGKTQIEICLMLDCVINDKTALVGMVDTEGKFFVKRLISILMARGLVKSEDEAFEKYLNRILIFKASTQDEQMMYIDNFSSMLAAKSNIKMMVIDSIISLFQSEFQGRGVMKEKFGIIKPMMQNLRIIAETYQIPIICINTVHKSPDMMYGLDSVIAAGGNSLGHPLTYIVKVERIGSSGKRRATMIKSPADPESEADFIITDKGIEDVERKK